MGFMYEYKKKQKQNEIRGKELTGHTNAAHLLRPAIFPLLWYFECYSTLQNNTKWKITKILVNIENA